MKIKKDEVAKCSLGSAQGAIVMSSRTSDFLITLTCANKLSWSS